MIEVKNLSKKFLSFKKYPGLWGSFRSLFKREYTEKAAVKNFDLSIGKGEVVGFLGPNGAGKTTLMKMFTGIIVPSSGETSVLGHVPARREKEFRKRIALVMGQKFQLWWDIPAMDSFRLLQKYYEIPEADFKKRINLMAAVLEVEALLYIHVRKLSLGERMKMELIASLLHSPEIIFLDEPTIGLDIVAQENIRQFIKNYQKETNCSIIITSHYMNDVTALCKRIVLILEGEKKFDGSIKKFENILGSEKQVSFKFSSPIEGELHLFKQLDARWNNQRTEVDLRIPGSELRQVSAKILRDLPVVEFNTEKMPIERVMKELMRNPQILRYKNDQPKHS